MVKKNIGIAEMCISSDPTEILIAPFLGSCLGISVYDTKRLVGGMIHCLLPLSKADPDKAKEKPYMYVDSGTAAMLNMLFEQGTRKEDLRIIVAGGANINDEANIFEIGKKNFTVLRKILWKNNLLIHNQDVGNEFSRTLSLHVGSGDVWLKAQGEEKKLNKGDNHEL